MEYGTVRKKSDKISQNKMSQNLRKMFNTPLPPPEMANWPMGRD